MTQQLSWLEHGRSFAGSRIRVPPCSRDPLPLFPTLPSVMNLARSKVQSMFTTEPIYASHSPHPHTFSLYDHSGEGLAHIIMCDKKTKHLLYLECVPGSNIRVADWLTLSFGWIPGSSVLTTELPNDSAAQLVRAWQIICWVKDLSPSLFPGPSSFISHSSICNEFGQVEGPEHVYN